MRAIVDAEAFSEALNSVSKLLPKSTLPILECVLIRFEKGRCALTASNLDTWLTLELPAQGDDFSLALRKPLTAVKACRYFEGKLTLELLEDDPKYPEAVFACGLRSGRFDAYPAEEYPAVPNQEAMVSFTANAAVLLKRIERVKYAVREPQGYSYRADQTCVQFSRTDVFCVDGCRAACDTDPALTFPRPFMTWGKSLACLKLMGDTDVTVYVGVHHIWLVSDAVTICCPNEGVDTFRLMDAVPKRFIEEFHVSPRDFLRELDYLDGFQPKSKSPVRFCGGKMALKNVEDRCSTAVKIEGENATPFGFDPRFMRDALRQFGGEKRVKVKLSGEIGPIILEAEGRNDFAMVLPVKLHETRAA